MSNGRVLLPHRRWEGRVESPISTILGGLSLDDTARRLWEPAAALLETIDPEPPDDRVLSLLESEARIIALDHVIALPALVRGFEEGGKALRDALAAAEVEGAERLCRSILTLERAAPARIGFGYAAGLEEALSRLAYEAEQNGPRDAVTGAMKPSEILEQLSLEVNRCQRMDLPIGLAELAVEHEGHGDACTRDASQEIARRVGRRLRENLRRYDSIGRTHDGCFLLIFPDVSRRGLTVAVERLRRELEPAVSPPRMVFSLAHFDYVDVEPHEMLATLADGMVRARAGEEYGAWS
jgi:GGDEF domain-containing protein